MTKGRMSIWGSAVALLLCLSPCGCDKSGGDESGSDRNDGPKAEPTATTSADQAPPAATTSADQAPPASKNLIEDASGAVGDVKEKIGGDKLMVLQLLIFPTYLQIQVQDPTNTENVNEYRWKDGKVAEPTAVKLSGADVATLSSKVFDLSEADLGAVPTMAADAQKRLEVEGGKVTHILLGRDAGIGNDPKFRVYISGSRENVSATYDAKGTFKKVWK